MNIGNRRCNSFCRSYRFGNRKDFYRFIIFCFCIYRIRGRIFGFIFCNRIIYSLMYNVFYDKNRFFFKYKICWKRRSIFWFYWVIFILSFLLMFFIFIYCIFLLVDINFCVFIGRGIFRVIFFFGRVIVVFFVIYMIRFIIFLRVGYFIKWKNWRDNWFCYFIFEKYYYYSNIVRWFVFFCEFY